MDFHAIIKIGAVITSVNWTFINDDVETGANISTFKYLHVALFNVWAILFSMMDKVRLEFIDESNI